MSKYKIFISKICIYYGIPCYHKYPFFSVHNKASFPKSLSFLFSKGSKGCTKDYGRCKSKCRGHSDKERACPNGKVCCRNRSKPAPWSQVIAKTNDCKAEGGICKISNKKCKNPLPFNCPIKDWKCCKKTKRTCRQMGGKCKNEKSAKRKS